MTHNHPSRSYIIWKKETEYKKKKEKVFAYPSWMTGKKEEKKERTRYKYPDWLTGKPNNGISFDDLKRIELTDDNVKKMILDSDVVKPYPLFKDIKVDNLGVTGKILWTGPVLPADKPCRRRKHKFGSKFTCIKCGYSILGIDKLPTRYISTWNRFKLWRTKRKWRCGNKKRQKKFDKKVKKSVRKRIKRHRGMERKLKWRQYKNECITFEDYKKLVDMSRKVADHKEKILWQGSETILRSDGIYRTGSVSTIEGGIINHTLPKPILQEGCLSEYTNSVMGYRRMDMSIIMWYEIDTHNIKAGTWVEILPDDCVTLLVIERLRSKNPHIGLVKEDNCHDIDEDFDIGRPVAVIVGQGGMVHGFSPFDGKYMKRPFEVWRNDILCKIEFRERDLDHARDVAYNFPKRGNNMWEDLDHVAISTEKSEVEKACEDMLNSKFKAPFTVLVDKEVAKEIVKKNYDSNKIKKRYCPLCMERIHSKRKECPHCGSDLKKLKKKQKKSPFKPSKNTAKKVSGFDLKVNPFNFSG